MSRELLDLVLELLLQVLQPLQKFSLQITFFLHLIRLVPIILNEVKKKFYEFVLNILLLALMLGNTLCKNSHGCNTNIYACTM